MNRRTFLGSSSAAALGAIAILEPGVIRATQAPIPPAVLPSSVHVLGPVPANNDQRLMRALSDDVFDQLLKRYRDLVIMRP